VAITSTKPPPTSNTDTSNVPPPKSKTSINCGSFVLKPYANAAASGSRNNFTFLKPASRPAFSVALH
jgi:hypothetical protein